MVQKRILLVEDDACLREAIAETLREARFAVTDLADAESGLHALSRDHFDLVLSDVQLPGMNGPELLTEARQLICDIPVILMTAYGTIEDAVIAMRRGANDYLVKPFEAEALLATVTKNLLVHNNYTESSVIVDKESKQLYSLAARVAQSSVSVLIKGESGAGKEVLAQFIHTNSTRSHMSYVAINCAAIPENMLESVLFGYEKGAFTGAYQRTVGKFELAQGGTLLLDEISEMDLALQAKLLRVLQEKEVERLGGNKPIKLDVRVLATTNRDLRGMVNEGKFREDLFYRLNVFPLTVPPLREHKLDILPLADAFVAKHKIGAQPTPEIAADAQGKLLAHSWPGNVRELENVMQRALVVCQNNQIVANDIILEDQATLVDTPFKNRSVSSDHHSELGNDLKLHEQELILSALKRGNGSRKLAAESLGISARTLRYKLSKMREQGISIPKAYGAISV